MHIRESQNAITQRAVNEAAQALPILQRTAQSAARLTPVADQAGATVLRAGVQNIEDALLGR
jgi:hypothetical protein